MLCYFWALSVTCWSTSPCIALFFFLSQLLCECYRASAGSPLLRDNMLGSGVVTAVIMWFTLMVYNYSQINYLQQTVVLYNEAANNQGLSAEHYNITPLHSLFNLSFSLCLYYCLEFTPFSPLLPYNLIPLQCHVAPNRGQLALSHPHHFSQRVLLDDECLRPTGQRGQPTSSMSH